MTENMQNYASLAKKIGQAHLTYLSLLPAIGTFLLFFIREFPVNFLLVLILGTAGIGIYLAITAAYTRISSHVHTNVLMLIDGPFWMIVASFFGTSLTESVINTVFEEITGALLGALLVIGTSQVPTPSERRNAAIAVGLPLIGITLLAHNYFSFAQTPTATIAIIVTAALQGAWTQYQVSKNMEIQRESEGFIIIGIVAWMLAFAVIGPLTFFIQENGT